MEKNTSKRRTDIAAETIGKQIVRGKLSIGQVLPNDQVMCETLGISRTILREALRILRLIVYDGTNGGFMGGKS